MRNVFAAIIALALPVALTVHEVAAQTVVATANSYVKLAATDTKAEPAKVEKAEFNYRAFSRDPKKYTGKLVTITGKVLQVIEDEDDLNMRVATNGSYENIVFVTYTRKSADESRVLDDDRVVITGKFEGIHSYKSVGAGPVSIPHVEADTIEQAPAISRRSRR
jgi:hypothetical protein